MDAFQKQLHSQTREREWRLRRQEPKGQSSQELGSGERALEPSNKPAKWPFVSVAQARIFRVRACVRACAADRQKAADNGTIQVVIF